MKLHYAATLAFVTLSACSPDMAVIDQATLRAEAAAARAEASAVSAEQSAELANQASKKIERAAQDADDSVRRADAAALPERLPERVIH